MLVFKQMAQVQAALVAKQLYPEPAIGVQRVQPYAVAHMHPERRKAAAGIKLFFRFKQLVSALCTGIEAGSGIACVKVYVPGVEHTCCFTI
jgi:hypothetical protein